MHQSPVLGELSKITVCTDWAVGWRGFSTMGKSLAGLVLDCVRDFHDLTVSVGCV